MSLCLHGPQRMLVFLYHQAEPVTQMFLLEATRNRFPLPKSGVHKLLVDAESPPKVERTDRRLTGSSVIDESLQEILGYILRDYVHLWYENLGDEENSSSNNGSSAEDFPEELRRAVQSALVVLAGRIKEVDWIPYLATRLVDDAASHMRLFRQARARLQGMASNASMANRCDSAASEASSETGQAAPNATGGTASSASPTPSLEELFFQMEAAMEDSLSRRDACTTPEAQQKFLQEVSEALLFLVLPEIDFQCRAVRFLARELLVQVVLAPSLRLLSDPDYVNQTVIWLCRDFGIPSEVFLTVLRVTDNKEELHATRDLVCKEISQLRSRDTGGEDDAQIKQQLRSLQYLRKVIDVRVQRLQAREGSGGGMGSAGSQMDWSRLLQPTGAGGPRVYQLPLDVVLRNPLALSYFMDHLAQVDAQHYLFCYLNVEGWRVAAEQQISAIQLDRMANSDSKNDQKSSPDYQGLLENMREAALSIFEQYFSDKASPRVRLDEGSLRRLESRLLSREGHGPSEGWFDEVQTQLHERLAQEEPFLLSFRRCPAYLRLLAELDLLRDPSSASRSDDDDSLSLDDLSLPDSASLSSLEVEGGTGTIEEIAGVNSNRGVSPTPIPSPALTAIEKLMENGASGEGGSSKQTYVLQAEVFETGVVQDHGKTYGIYAVSVTRRFELTGREEKWHIYRRYSDFYDLFRKVKEKYSDLARLPFPAKKTFNNTERAVLEQRMLMLHELLQGLLQPAVLHTHPLLQDMVLKFLEGREYDRGGGPFGKKLDTLVRESLKSVSQAVKSVPETVSSRVDGVMDGLRGAFGGGSGAVGGKRGGGGTGGRGTSPLFDSAMGELCSESASKVGASLDVDADDNIPLRIMLLLMDEVFDLRSRNQWLRRRIVAILRQIIKGMFGDIVNRRIVEYVAFLTGPDRVAEYLRSFKQTLWPNGSLALPPQARDDATKLRTRVAAKAALLAGLSDELKHILGSETTRQGLLLVFELFQHPVLNRRLLLVLMEGVLATLFPHHQFPALFRRLHASSSHSTSSDSSSHPNPPR